MARALTLTLFRQFGIEILLRDKIWTRSEILETRVLGWSSELVTQNIGNRIIRDQVMMDTSNSDAQGLLDQPPLYKAIGIHNGFNK